MIKVMKTDEELLFAYQRKDDKAALEKLIARHFQPSYRRAYRILGDPAAADDAVQEALISLIRGARRFREGERFKPWWLRILYNRVRDEDRKLKAKNQRDLIVGQARPLQSAPVHPRDEDPKHKALRAGLETLPFATRAAVVLHFFEGRSHKDVGRVMDVPTGTVSSRIRRGLNQLRTSLKTAGHGALATGLETTLTTFVQSAPTVTKAPALATLESLALKVTLKAALMKASAVTVIAIAAAFGLSRLAPQSPQEAKTRQRSAAIIKTSSKASGVPKTSPPSAQPKESQGQEGEENSAKTKAGPGGKGAPARRKTSAATSPRKPKGGTAPKTSIRFPKSVITVLVRDDKGRPQPRAAIFLRSTTDVRETRRAPTTNKAGIYRLTCDKNPNIEIVARYENLIGSVAIPEEPPKQLIIDLRPIEEALPDRAGLTLTLASESGPISNTEFNFKLRCFKAKFSKTSRRSSNNQGRVFLNDLPEGTYTVSIESKDYAFLKTTFELVSGKVLQGEVQLSEGCSLSGSLEVPKGVDSSEIYISARLNKPFVHVSADFADGRYHFKHLGPGSYTIYARAPGYAEAKAEVVIGEDSKVEGPPLSFDNGYELVGHAVDRSGEPLSGLKLRLTTKDDQFLDLSDSELDGRFLFPLVPSGTYTLSAWANNYQHLLFTQDLQIVGPRDLGNLVMLAARYLRIVVRDETGQPVSKARVLLQDHTRRFGFSPDMTFPFHKQNLEENRLEVMTDEDGEAEVLTTSDKSVRLLASKGRFCSSIRPVDLTKGDQNLELILNQELGSAAVRLALPAESFVVLLPQDPSDPLPIRGLKTSKQGNLLLENLPPGAYFCEIRQLNSSPFELRSGERRELFIDNHQPPGSPLEINFRNFPKGFQGSLSITSKATDKRLSREIREEFKSAHRILFLPSGSLTLNISAKLSQSGFSYEYNFSKAGFALPQQGTRLEISWPKRQGILRGNLSTGATAALDWGFFKLLINKVGNHNGPFEVSIPIGRHQVNVLPNSIDPAVIQALSKTYTIELQAGEIKDLNSAPATTPR